MNSLLDCMSETSATVAIITETWMRSQPELMGLVQDLSLGAGIGMVNRNRDPGERELAHGGVTVLRKETDCSLRNVDLKIPNPSGFEVLVAARALQSHTRKLVVLACYIPPNYTRKKGNNALNFVDDCMVEIKRRYKYPYILVGGDFNQWRIDDCLADYADIREALIGPTRGSRSIDRIFTNLSRTIKESGSLSPLETEGSNTQ